MSKKYYPIYIVTYYIKWTTTFGHVAEKKYSRGRSYFTYMGLPKLGLSNYARSQEGP